MNKLIKVIAIKDEFMDTTGEQFCIKGKEYIVIKQDEKEFMIISEASQNHWFDYDDCHWFKLIFENEENFKVVYTKHNLYCECEEKMFYNYKDFGKWVHDNWKRIEIVEIRSVK